MKKTNILLTVFLLVFLVALPSSADKLTLTGEYTNSTVNEHLLEEEGFNSILGPHYLSLNLGYTYKNAEFNIGIKNFDLTYDVSEIDFERYMTGQSFYISLDSDNFDFSYLRGDYEEYAFDPEDDVIGFNFLIQNLDISQNEQHNYLLPEFDNSCEFGIAHENLFRTSFSIGKLSVVGYYLDSDRTFTAFDYLDPYNSRSLISSMAGSSLGFYGLAVSAKLNLSEYFNVGVTYSDINYFTTTNPPIRELETLGLGVDGELPVVSGEYFANALITNYTKNASDEIKSEKFALVAGLKDVGLRDDSVIKIGLDYVYSDRETRLFSDYGSALGQTGIYKEYLYDSADYKDIHRAGVSLGIYFTQNLSLNLNNGILFSKGVTANAMQILGNITTLNFNYADVKGNKFEIYARNDYDLLSGAPNRVNAFYAEASGKINIGNILDLGLKSENTYEFMSPSTNSFYGATNLWALSDMIFQLSGNNSVEVALGGAFGIIYGNVYEDLLNDYGEQLGRFNYDLYAGTDAKILDKLNMKLGIYVGTDTYIAHALLSEGDLKNYNDFVWNDINLVASTTISYDVSEMVVISLTGTYRNWQYALTSQTRGYLNDYKVVKIADEVGPNVNTKYFLQAKVDFKPSDSVMVSLSLGHDGLANKKAIQSDNAMKWDYLKIPIGFSELMTFKHIELNVSISF